MNIIDALLRGKRSPLRLNGMTSSQIVVIAQGRTGVTSISGRTMVMSPTWSATSWMSPTLQVR